jgi:D-beta-D-heptose 7-phosphate kinase/D-beta-D-heptose 1-phosphate adenosyltransferase
MGERTCRVTLDELLALVGPAARDTRTVVFSNGCFDLLHAGHVHCLRAAKALGDILVVGVNSDASVRRLKGASRPVVDQHHRAAMLAALTCVDHVVIFDDDTPERLIAELRPDVLVKGAEPRRGLIPGETIVASYGGRLELVPALPGISTTTLIERLALPQGEGRSEGGRNDAPSSNLTADA